LQYFSVHFLEQNFLSLVIPANDTPHSGQVRVAIIAAAAANRFAFPFAL
jgi:hypothetical protein